MVTTFPQNAPEIADTRATFPTRGIYRRFLQNRLAVFGSVVICSWCLLAILAPLLAPFDPGFSGDRATELSAPPSTTHLLGTDNQARDVFSRILYGGRISLFIGFLAVGISVTLGTVVGAVSGFFGGIVDRVLMRTVDVFISFPRLVLLIAVVAVFDRSVLLLTIVLGLTQWPATARIVRGEVLSIREREFIEAARSLGFSRRRIVFRHLIPNVLAPVIVTGTLAVGNTILLESGLSFLGVGVEPTSPSWGSIVADGRAEMLNAWWISTFSGLAIVFTVLAFNLVGDGLRDALDPRLKGS